jgi:hypothetical protein
MAMTLQEITATWLQENGYDGLFLADTCCGCALADLMPCGEPSPFCEPGYLGESCECGGDCRCGIYREKQIMSIPSVTEIIGFVNSQAFNMVPEFRLEAAAARGIDLHAAVAASLQGLFYKETPEISGYFKSCRDWANEYLVKVIGVEMALVDNKRRFQGHLDLIGLIQGDEGFTIIDWKTPKALSKTWRLQLAGYRLLALANGYDVRRVASLRPDPGGGPAKFDGYSKTLVSDSNSFLSALNVWKFFKGSTGS